MPPVEIGSPVVEERPRPSANGMGMGGGMAGSLLGGPFGGYLGNSLFGGGGQIGPWQTTTQRG